MTSGKITCTKKIGQNFRIFYNEAETEALGLEVGDIVEVTTTIIRKYEPEPDPRLIATRGAPSGMPPEIRTRWAAFSVVMKNLSKEYPKGIPADILYQRVGEEMTIPSDLVERMLNSFKEVGEVFEPKKGFWLWSN